MSPNKAVFGMRVIYGRCGYERSGWLGTVTSVNFDTFTVAWDNNTEPTTYKRSAWSHTPFRNKLRDRNVHYIFFDETAHYNKVNFPQIFNCGTSTTSSQNEVDQNMKLPSDKKGFVENFVRVNGRELTTMNETDLINFIKKLENEKKTLQEITTKSVRINMLVGEYDKALAEVVKELDSRD